ncbi:uncharacterized protein LOC112086694 isoform X2 [Eutrema salsugineum]|uniref:uncharacterized protein LOC112086694 isoform X2 n=1 Tax=Eutrema salsugineum TaxID=72664 RepID=UPI000CED0E41|nr:uncharacterized protein LOC112086694 isoform X2 [Eutrema salsugineum]
MSEHHQYFFREGVYKTKERNIFGRKEQAVKATGKVPSCVYIKNRYKLATWKISIPLGCKKVGTLTIGAIALILRL